MLSLSLSLSAKRLFTLPSNDIAIYFGIYIVIPRVTGFAHFIHHVQASHHCQDLITSPHLPHPGNIYFKQQYYDSPVEYMSRCIVLWNNFISATNMPTFTTILYGRRYR